MRRYPGQNLRAIGSSAVVLWWMSALPGVVAEQVCYTTFDGFWKCTQRLSLGARIAICIGASILLSILITLCACVGIRRRRVRNQEAIASVYQVDASQINGPALTPATYVTSFDPRSPANYPLPNSAYPVTGAAVGTAAIPPSPDPPTSFPKTPAGYANTPDALSPNPKYYDTLAPPRSPVPSARSPHVRFQERYPSRSSSNSSSRSPHTAPVNPPYQAQGAYPFPGYSSRSGAIQQPQTAYTHGFPRPLYTGQPVKKDRERNEIV